MLDHSRGGRCGARGRPGAVALVGASLLACAAAAQAASYRVNAGVNVTETYSDNINLAAAGAEKSAFVTQILPRISVNSTGGGRIRLNLDAGLDGALYSGGGGNSRTNLRLGADARVEAIENFFFIDAKYSVQQTNLSLFSSQPVDNTSITGNRAEVRTFSVSPYFRGLLPGRISYELRYNFISTDTDATQIGSPHTSEWRFSLSQPTAVGPLGWAFNYTNRTTSSSAGTDRESTSYNGTITYQVDPTLRLFVRAGQETNNYSNSQSSATRGLGFDWQVTPRTSLSANRDRRFFGSSYSLQFNHRFPQSAFSLGMTRSLTTSADLQLLNVQSLILPSAAAAVVNDPVATRQVLVQALPPAFAGLIASLSDAESRRLLIDLLLAQNIAQIGNAQVPFLTDRIVVSKSLNASYAIRGRRNNVVLSASRSESQSASTTGAAGADDLSNATSVVSQSLSGTWNHSLTPAASLGATVTQTRSHTTGGTGLSSRHRLFNVYLSSRLGARSTGTVSVRHQTFDSATDYSENAVIGTLNYNF